MKYDVLNGKTGECFIRQITRSICLLVRLHCRLIKEWSIKLNCSKNDAKAI